jgi:hypothetical protein
MTILMTFMEKWQAFGRRGRLAFGFTSLKQRRCDVGNSKALRLCQVSCGDPEMSLFGGLKPQNIHKISIKHP